MRNFTIEASWLQFYDVEKVCFPLGNLIWLKLSHASVVNAFFYSFYAFVDCRGRLSPFVFEMFYFTCLKRLNNAMHTILTWACAWMEISQERWNSLPHIIEFHKNWVYKLKFNLDGMRRMWSAEMKITKIANLSKFMRATIARDLRQPARNRVAIV